MCTSIDVDHSCSYASRVMIFRELTERCGFSEMWCCSCYIQIKGQFACRILPVVVNMNSGKDPNFFSKTETAETWHQPKMLLHC